MWLQNCLDVKQQVQLLTMLLQRLSDAGKFTFPQSRYCDIKFIMLFQHHVNFGQKMHPAIYHRFCSDNLDTTLEPQCQIQNVFYFLRQCCVSFAKNVKCGLFMVSWQHLHRFALRLSKRLIQHEICLVLRVTCFIAVC